MTQQAKSCCVTFVRHRLLYLEKKALLFHLIKYEVKTLRPFNDVLISGVQHIINTTVTRAVHFLTFGWHYILHSGPLRPKKSVQRYMLLFRSTLFFNGITAAAMHSV